MKILHCVLGIALVAAVSVGAGVFARSTSESIPSVAAASEADCLVCPDCPACPECPLSCAPPAARASLLTRGETSTKGCAACAETPEAAATQP